MALIWLVVFQGIYFSTTAIWALIDIDSFMFVTGPKTDIWLVKTMSLLILAVGFTLLEAVYSKRQLGTAVVLGVVSALALGIADTYYALTNQISKIYLLDAGVEFLIVLGYLMLKSKWVRI